MLAKTVLLSIAACGLLVAFQHSSALADPQTPKRVLDPISKEVFVLLPEHTYEQVCRRLLAEESGEIDVGCQSADWLRMRWPSTTPTIRCWRAISDANSLYRDDANLLGQFHLFLILRGPIHEDVDRDSSG